MSTARNPLPLAAIQIHLVAPPLAEPLVIKGEDLLALVQLRAAAPSARALFLQEEIPHLLRGVAEIIAALSRDPQGDGFSVDGGAWALCYLLNLLSFGAGVNPEARFTVTIDPEVK